MRAWAGESCWWEAHGAGHAALPAAPHAPLLLIARGFVRMESPNPSGLPGKQWATPVSWLVSSWGKRKKKIWPEKNQTLGTRNHGEIGAV